MALNVGLIFKVKRFDGSKIPDYEKWYGLIAYGVPAMAPIIYLIHDQMSSQRLIGPAIVSLTRSLTVTNANVILQLWCWVRKEFDWMRIAFFYAPMWYAPSLAQGTHALTVAGY